MLPLAGSSLGFAMQSPHIAIKAEGQRNDTAIWQHEQSYNCSNVAHESPGMEPTLESTQRAWPPGEGRADML